jgi:hypothetical protein
MIPLLPEFYAEKVGLELRWQAADGLPATKWGYVMWILDKDAIGGEPNDGSASPVLVIVALGLFSLLVLGAADVHRELLIAAIFTIGESGIEPLFVGP